MSLRHTFSLVLLLAFACACSSGPTRSAEDARPEPAVAYTLELLDADEPSVEVTLAARADASGECVLSLGEVDASFPFDERDFKGLAASSADDRALALEPLADGRWRVRTRPGERITARWTASDLGRDRENDQRECYRPLLTARFFHLLGSNGLLAPEHLGEEPIEIALAWKGFAERGWHVACSFGADPAGIRVRRQLDEFRGGLFVASPLAFQSREVGGRALTIALLGEDWKIEANAFADLCARILGAERDFFDDPGAPHYLISAVPIGAPNPKSMSLGGTGLTDAFALFFLRGSDLTSGGPMHERVVRVLAHEMMHNWCGRATPPEQPERLVYWFTEGFTEFLTRRLLLRSGLTDVEAYAASLQESVRGYLANPHCRAPNALVEAEFWSSREVSELPYRRGDLVAALLDHAIRTRSAGRSSLDDFVREAVRLGSAGEKISTPVLIARIERWTGAPFAERIRAIVEEGAELALPADLFAPCVEITSVLEPMLELGFDFDASVASGKLTAVREGSAAEAAGVREGQKLASISYERRVDRPVRLEVIEDGERRKLEFLPHGAPQATTAVRVVSSKGCGIL